MRMFEYYRRNQILSGLLFSSHCKQFHFPYIFLILESSSSYLLCQLLVICKSSFFFSFKCWLLICNIKTSKVRRYFFFFICSYHFIHHDFPFLTKKCFKELGLMKAFSSYFAHSEDNVINIFASAV